MALAKRSKKPGLTSVTRGDDFLIEVDTSLSERGVAHAATSAAAGDAADGKASAAAAAGGGEAGAVPVLQLTYLESYEQVGVVTVACHQGCACRNLTVDTLVPSRRFATLSTALSPPVSKAS